MVSPDEFLRDVRHGLRRSLAKPGVPLAILALLTLGIGVNTAAFAIMEAVVLEPLPYDAPEAIVAVWGTDDSYPRFPASGPDFLDWRSQGESFEQLVADSPQAMNLGLGAEGEPERVNGSSVTAGLFALLRVRPQLGRVFDSEEEREGARVAVLSDALWRRRFAADPAALGRTILLDGEEHTVIGIMPPGFSHPCLWSLEPTDLWRPLSLDALREGRDTYWLLVLGRVRDGVSLATAQEELDVIAGRLAEAYPDTNDGRGARLAPMQDELLGPLADQLRVLLAATALILLIAFGNVAGLLVARASTRRTELAVRVSLGANSRRLVSQSLAETLPLFLLGGAASLLFAGWATGVLRAELGATIPRASGIAVSSSVALWALALSLTGGVVFGLFTGWRATRRGSALMGASRGALSTTRASTRARAALAVVQIGMTLVLANGAALMIQSYRALWNRDHGFSTEGVLTLRLNPSGPAYESPERVQAFYRRALERIEAIPGVRRAAAISRLPLGGGTNASVLVEGAPPSDEGGPLAEVRMVTPAYFETIGIPMLTGRDLRDGDGGTAESGANVVINERLARLAWPGEPALGKRIRFDDNPWFTVVGVVGNTRQWGLETEIQPEVYVPYVPWGNAGFFSFSRVRFFVVRAQVEPTSLVGDIKASVAELDPNLPLFDIRTTEGLVTFAIARRRVQTVLFGLFAITALVLSVTGVYSVTSFFVAQRTREFGLRMALGARRALVHRLVLGHGARLATLGVALGCAGVLATTRLTASLLYGVSPTEPTILLSGAAALVLVSLLGTLLPSLRATRVDPVVALRAE